MREAAGRRGSQAAAAPGAKGCERARDGEAAGCVRPSGEREAARQRDPTLTLVCGFMSHGVIRGSDEGGVEAGRESSTHAQE